MLKTQRQEELIKMLEREEIMRISDLSLQLGSSMMTIRRDLDHLEIQGLVKRIHGGVILAQKINNDSLQPSFHQRVEEYKYEKQRIGKEAVERIKPGDIVFFDAGTTTLSMVDYIPDNLEFTAITTGLLTAVALIKKNNVNIVAIGGNIHKSSYSAVNHMAVDMINKFHANIAFISTKAFSMPWGTFEAQINLIEVKKAMVKSSEQVILLADHSKFNSKSLSQSVSLADIDEIITDTETEPNIINSLKEASIKITIV